MRLGDIKLAIVTSCLMLFTGTVLAANSGARTCAAIGTSQQHSIVPTGGSGGTGHTTTVPGGVGGTGNTVLPDSTNNNRTEAAIDSGGIGGTGNTPPTPPGGIGGTGIKAAKESGGIGGTGIEIATESGGIGGTGNTPIIPPGGIGGTGITVAGLLSKASGDIAVLVGSTHKQQLAVGDEICVGDKVIVGNNSQAKITFSDGAILHVLKNSEVRVDDYAYVKTSPQESHSIVSLIKGDIRSVSGAISKINPAQYAVKTPIATINVVGTDFLVTHLPENSQGTLKGTYVKVVSGSVNVSTPISKILLRAGESTHVLLNGIQSIINSTGGTCAIP